MVRLDAFTTLAPGDNYSNPRSLSNLIATDNVTKYRVSSWLQLHTRKPKKPSGDKNKDKDKEMKPVTSDELDASDPHSLKCYHRDAVLLIEATQTEATVIFTLRVPSKEFINPMLIVSFPEKNIQTLLLKNILSPEYFSKIHLSNCTF
ncbi:hypothetical protein Moror_9401 [Moniliophthora roreri MCA 2997]|uniref:Uncharacterized protein n=1 Tax=Moniliophthora roreri (strain MCA 2997) TaxID=1381753 RepID=V2WGP2_MONRO|nr:hypothetical protein Moror_9401 [Moniliophthora roreri MCA 2997]